VVVFWVSIFQVQALHERWSVRNAPTLLRRVYLGEMASRISCLSSDQRLVCEPSFGRREKIVNSVAQGNRVKKSSTNH